MSFWFFGSPHARPTFENATLHSSSPEFSPAVIISAYGRHTLQLTNLLAVFDDIVMLGDEKCTASQSLASTGSGALLFKYL